MKSHAGRAKMRPMETTEMEQTPLVKAGISIVRTLAENGFSAVFAGGCVRDQLMGLPVQDIDIATDATPKTIQKLFKRTVPVGAQFGVVLVLKDKFKFEVATFRSDEGYSDGRHPDAVRFSSLEEDVRRRDFTINGLMYDPVEKRVIDLVHGREDIQAGIVRAIGDPQKRFEEDKLRMLRAVRFSARFRFEIEKQTLLAIKPLAHEINGVSAERIGEELTKTLTGGNAGYALRQLSETGLLAEILPEVEMLKNALQDPEKHPEGAVFDHTAAVLEHLPDAPSKALAFAALLHDAGKGLQWKETGGTEYTDHHERSARVAEAVCRRLKFSNADRARIRETVFAHSAPYVLGELKKSAAKRMFHRVDAKELFSLFLADVRAFSGDESIYRQALEVYETLEAEGIKPDPLVTGQDLKDLGLKPGPHFSRILGKVYDAQLDLEAATRDDALALAKKLVAESGG